MYEFLETCDITGRSTSEGHPGDQNREGQMGGGEMYYADYLREAI